MPLTLYPVPPATTELTVMLALPVFCTVMAFVAEVPTVWLPKLRIEGLIEITGEAVPTPVPWTGRMRLRQRTSFVAKESEPISLPVDFGAYVT